MQNLYHVFLYFFFYRLAFEASVANNRRFDDVNVTFPIEVSDPNVRQDCHSVSSLLKLYFRELPDPLCTYKLYEEFLSAAKVPEDLRLSAMRKVVKCLPNEHLRYTLRHSVNLRNSCETESLKLKSIFQFDKAGPTFASLASITRKF